MTALSTSLLSLNVFEQFVSSWFGRFPEPAPQPGAARVQPTHLLHALETLWIDAAPGQRVTCVDGCVLLQQHGRPRGDVILVRGESHACEAGSRLTLQALVATALRLG